MSKFGGSITYVFMKMFFLSLALVFSEVEVMAQQQYFVFIQEASRQPFYVRIKEESHSSSAIGHIILSQLKDSVYNFFIGFPRSRYSEQLFIVPMNRKDHGYELRNSGGRYQLFDLMTQQVLMPSNSTPESDQTIRKNDTYSQLMADVVEDSAVLYTSAQDTMVVDSNATVLIDSNAAVVVKDSVAKKPAAKKNNTKGKKQPAAVAKTVAADTVKVASADEKTAEHQADSAVARENNAAPDSSATAANRDRRDIIRIGTENVSGGKLMIYVDRSGPVNDTIRLIIPRRL
jgi:hypothetical protein